MIGIEIILGGVINWGGHIKGGHVDLRGKGGAATVGGGHINGGLWGGHVDWGGSSWGVSQ